jgi:hypothetical protein
MEMNPEFFAFLEHVTGREPDPDDVDCLGGMQTIEIAWPLNDIIRPHLPAIAAIPYDIAAEAECDGALTAYALNPSPATLTPLSLPGWRVLVDRHTSFCAIAALNEAAGNGQFFMLPRGFPAEHRLGALLLGYYLRFPREHLRDDPDAPRH